MFLGRQGRKKVRQWVQSWLKRIAVVFSIATVLILWVLVPRLVDRGHWMAAKDTVTRIDIVLQQCRADHVACPRGDTTAVWQTLIQHDYIRDVDMQKLATDPWGSPYRIDVSDPERPKVWSPGKNRKDEPSDLHSDDICSWR